MSEQGLTGIAALEAEMRDRLAAKDATIAEQAQRIETLERQALHFVKSHMEDPLICGICGKLQDDVEKLICGEAACICGDCAAIAYDIDRVAKLEAALDGAKIVHEKASSAMISQSETIAEQAQRIAELEAAVAGKVELIEPSKEAVEWAEGVFAEEDVKDARISELKTTLGEAGEALEPFAEEAPNWIDAEIFCKLVVEHFDAEEYNQPSFDVCDLRKAKAIREKIRDLCHEQSGRAESKGSAQVLPNDQSGCDCHLHENQVCDICQGVSGDGEDDLLTAQFKPCVVNFDESGLTEMVLEDSPTVWQNVGCAIELGFRADGRLIGVRFPTHLARSHQSGDGEAR